METEAAMRIWQRTSSYATPLQFTTFLSDGDSKAYGAVSEENFYGTASIVKEDCTNHVAKRLGTGLRKLKTPLPRGQKLKDGTIQKLQSYFQIAITTPPHTPILTTAQAKAILPIYKRLTEEKLLSRCVQGKTQNAAESLNSKIWMLCPKTRFASCTVVEMATAIATLWFNKGHIGFEQVLQELGILPSQELITLSSQCDKKRIASMTTKGTAEARSHRRRMDHYVFSLDVEDMCYNLGLKIILSSVSEAIDLHEMTRFQNASGSTVEGFLDLLRLYLGSTLVEHEGRVFIQESGVVPCNADVSNGTP
ncbi:hypothetical protein HPB47_027245 [Ixodes persulcatus]|uniref:Uncharacterized protein n=1 Tax=Ixodes persulcatus TaxID=34615 RepID=A0AC60PXV6_IXOPE|nr:hypothetical protein HPB47_027245 [Ixodes persulcatus]